MNQFGMIDLMKMDKMQLEVFSKEIIHLIETKEEEV